MGRETRARPRLRGRDLLRPGQAFMVQHSRNLGSVLELKGAKVCVQAGTTTELNLQDYFQANGMNYEEAGAGRLRKPRSPPTSKGAVMRSPPMPRSFTASGSRRPGPTTTTSFPRSSRRSRSAPPCGRRFPVVHDREVGALRDAGSRGKQRHRADDRRRDGTEEAGRDAAGRHGGPVPARNSG